LLHCYRKYAERQPGSAYAISRRSPKAAGEPKSLWGVPEAGHIAGITAQPREYERRVTAFFDRALLRR
jgi:hypothetical protein